MKGDVKYDGVLGGSHEIMEPTTYPQETYWKQ